MNGKINQFGNCRDVACNVSTVYEEANPIKSVGRVELCHHEGVETKSKRLKNLPLNTGGNNNFEIFRSAQNDEKILSSQQAQ